MPLHKIKDFYPDYREHFSDHDIMGYGLYSGTEKIGSVDDLLVDDEGRFRYLIINTGAWIFGKKVLLPIGQARLDYNQNRVYVDGLTRDQVEALPEYDPNAPLDYDYEERVRGVYRPSARRSGVADTPLATGTTPLDTPTPLDATPGIADRDRTTAYDRDTYRYDRDPDLFNLNDQNHQNLRLYEERLVATKTRQKTGEVAVGKRVETETARVSVPIEKERVVVERVTPTDAGTPVTPGTEAFQEGEVARVEVYEETPDIRKEAFVREEVRVRKEVDQDTVEAEDTIRKERLDVNKDGNPIINDTRENRDRRI